MCAKLTSTGVCIDSRCPFAHCQDQLRHTDVYYKTKICVNWEKHRCLRGISCRMAHGVGELRSRNTPESKSATHGPLSDRHLPTGLVKWATQLDHDSGTTQVEGGEVFAGVDCDEREVNCREVSERRLVENWDSKGQEHSPLEDNNSKHANRRCSQATTCAGDTMHDEDSDGWSWDVSGDGLFSTHEGEWTGRTTIMVVRGQEEELLLSPPERLKHYQETLEEATCCETHKCQQYKGPPIETLRNFLYVQQSSETSDKDKTDKGECTRSQHLKETEVMCRPLTAPVQDNLVIGSVVPDDPPPTTKQETRPARDSTETTRSSSSDQLDLATAHCSAPFCFECFREGVGGYGIGYYAAVGCLATSGQTRERADVCPCCGLPHWLSSCLASQYQGLLCAPLRKLPEAYEE
eukprot:GHVS01042767.1.p1 GENE.GHVS01042767.1~~GHVS01042767.1.p1  ORF type:complete len:407 (+),score=51.99 GHVS01042767.1:426-1646(+)